MILSVDLFYLQKIWLIKRKIIISKWKATNFNCKDIILIINKF